jgi:crotonobetainyl-CoA:carnitine CoA-transferase CaiB-like acyl-CoA transferase
MSTEHDAKSTQSISSGPAHRQPLAGLRIIEISDTPSASFATVLLADLGATVIICEPAGGSALRRLGPDAVQKVWWPIIARNKFSVLIDFDDPDRVSTLTTLLTDCDLVVRDRPIAWLEQACAHLSRPPQDLLILPTGADRPTDWPWSTAPEFAEAASGVMALTGFAEGAPGMPEIPLASHTTAMLAAASALFERRAARQSGRLPKPLRFALHEALMRMIEWQIPVAQAQGRAELRNGNRFPMNSNIGNIFRAADETLLTISAATASVADRLLGLIGGDELRSDPRFSSAQARRDHMDELEALIAAWISGRSGREVIDQMRAADTVVGTIDDASTVLADPHLAQRGTFVEQMTDEHMPIMPSPIPRMTPPAGKVWRGGAHAGADNETILGAIDRGIPPWILAAAVCSDAPTAQHDHSLSATPLHSPSEAGPSPEPVPLPLTGLRVIELGSVIAAPFAASLLADLGAEVIKIERPEGDALRNMGLRDQGVPLWWGVASRAKRLCVMDLKQEDDRAGFLKLIERADVLIENNRPGVMERLGLSWEVLRQRNPRLVMLSISGFGQSGPYAQRPGFGKIAEGLSGVVALTGEPDGLPLHVGFSLADTAAGLAGVLGIAEVLHERDVDRTGVGRWIDLALYEPLIRINECQAALTRLNGSPPRRTGHSDPWSFGASTSTDRRLVRARCADREWIVAIQDDRATRRLNQAGFKSIDELSRDLERPGALLRLKSIGIEAAPVHEGYSIGHDPYFLQRGDVRLWTPGTGGERRVPGITPRGYGEDGLKGFDAQPIDPTRRSIDWLPDPSSGRR